MKNILRLALVSIATSILAVSCQKSIEEKVETPVLEPVIRTFKCIIADPDPDSKVDIDNTGKTTWAVDDEILVHGEYIGTSGGKQYSTIIKLTAGDIIDEGKTAIISVPIDEDGLTGIVPYIHKDGEPKVQDYKSTLYACYPASAVKSGNYHTYYYNVFTSFDQPLMAGYDDGDTFVFYNLGSVITFSVPNSEDFDSYVLEANGDTPPTISYGQFSTRVGMHLTDGLKYNVPYVSSNATYGTLSASSSVSGTLVCDDSIHTICIPGGANMADGFTFYFLKGGDIKKYARVTSSVDLSMSSKKGKVLHLGSISGSKLHTYTAAHVPATWTDGTGLSGVLDKSASPANCYILYAADADKAVKIKAVKGSSSTPVGTIASVEILWETNNTSSAVASNAIVADVDYSADSQYIFIKTPASFTPGNALIAARNAVGDIIWSWHIWMPNSTVNDVAATGFCGAGYIQDRNLGALTTTALAGDADPLSIGLYYQWGRKDPFPGHHSFGTDAAAALSAGSTSITKHGVAATPDYAVAHPTEYIHVSESEIDWTTSHPSDLWDNSGDKTIYDPCPAGYRVPLRDDTKPMWSGSNTSWDFSNDTKYVYNSAFAFPLSGYIDCYGGSYYKSKVRAFVWSATSKDDNSAYCLLNYGATVANVSFQKPKAGSVRCVTE